MNKDPVEWAHLHASMLWPLTLKYVGSELDIGQIKALLLQNGLPERARSR